ncbi:MAG TPA: ATP-dependent 6-phosphofructokinase [Candidatus Nitrosotenuis sp.]|jgi:6-phosphofructokinase 1|nr:ATP-dependent 6-phosphofructokinase [Candidatus Nitrosotenuis sp.]
MRLALTTGGGDAPGLNAVLRAATLAALRRGWQVLGIRDGFNGLLLPQEYPDGLVTLDGRAVRGITHLGGTILGSTNKGNPFEWPVRDPDGTVRCVDRSKEVVEALREHGIEALVCIGGDGSMGIAAGLHRLGVRVVGVPKTIDNDLEGTVVTFGFDSAVAFATECLDRLHSTAASHRRVMVVEVMGRYAGWIALECGLAGTADVILLPEIPYDMASVARKIEERFRHAGFAIVVVAEGARPRDGQREVLERQVGRAERLGGIGARVAREIEEATGQETRVVVLGHLLRGGTPTATDRSLSLRFGAAAVRALAEGCSGVMVALDPPRVRYVSLAEAVRRMKTVPLDCDTVLTLRDLGVCLGD